MTDYYNYNKRHIATTQAGRTAKANQTSLSVLNADALYKRPKLIHSGPCIHPTPQQPQPNAWPWVRLDNDIERNILLDQCMFFPQHQRGVLDISLRVIGASAARPAGNKDPIEVVTQANILFDVHLRQFEDLNITPVTKRANQHEQPIKFYPATIYPARPVLTLINLGWGFLSPAYNKNIQIWGDPITNKQLRPPQLYAQDLPLLQTVRFSVEYSLDDFNPDYPIICEVRANHSGDEIIWDDSLSEDGLRDPEFLRLFNVGSEIRERGI